MSRVALGLLAGVLGLALSLVSAGWVEAAPDAFALGQGAKSGEICDAQARDHDPAAQVKGGHAWTVECRAWSHPLGELYVFTGSEAAPSWLTELAARANCSGFTPTTLSGFVSARRGVCTDKTGGEYVVIEATAARGMSGKITAVAEGSPSIADLLERGLRTVTGLQAAQVQGVRVAAHTDDADSPTARRRAAYALNQRLEFRDAEAVFGALDRDPNSPPAKQAEDWLNWALNASDQGRTKEAAQRFAEADRRVAELGNVYLESMALNYKAIDALNRSGPAEAAEKAQRVIDGAVGSGQHAATSSAARIDPALATALNVHTELDGVNSLDVQHRMAVLNAQAHYILGTAKWELGDATEADRQLGLAENIFSVVGASAQQQTMVRSSVWLRAEIANRRALVALDTGNSAEAIKHSQRALTLLQERPDLAGGPVAALFLLNTAYLEQQAGATDAALNDYAEGFDLFRETRGSLGQSGNAAAAYFDLLLVRSKTDPTHAVEYKERMFAAMQSVVDETTADTVKRMYAGVTSGDQAAAHQARLYEDTTRELALARGKVRRLQEAGAPLADQAAAAARVKELDASAGAMQQKLLETNPRYGGVVTSVATIDAVQKALKPGEVYVKLILLDSKGFGIAITPDAATPYVIDRGRDQIRDDVHQLRRPFDRQGDTVGVFNVPTSRGLFKTVFGAVGDQVANARHLIYEPDGPLTSFPAEMLVTDDASASSFDARRKEASSRQDYSVDLYQGTAWLGRKTDVSLEVSPSAFMQARRAPSAHAQRAFLGFADPITQNQTDPRLFSLLTAGAGDRMSECQAERQNMITDLHRLKVTADAVNTIAARFHSGPNDVLTGTAFTDTAVMARGDPQSGDMQTYRVVFFGTHGLLPRAGDCLPEPALVTSLGAGDSDGLLTISDILKMRMNADLVVLSACDTGGGSDDISQRTGLTGSGAALDGIARAFIYAGARDMIVSHWSVDAAATGTLMTALFTSGEGASEADALRRAQLQLMDRKESSNPYFWAAFSLVGDGAHPLPGM